MTENLLKRIATNIKLKEELDTKTLWLELKTAKEQCIRALAKTTYDVILDKFRDYKSFKYPQKWKDYKTEVTIGVERNQRDEEILERLILLANNTKENVWANQFPICDISKSTHFDLLKISQNYLNIIELKRWPCNSNGKCIVNTPIYAAVEVVKNYFAYKKTLEERKEVIPHKKAVLTVLAPSAYYDYFEKNNKQLWDNFKLYLMELQRIFQNEMNEDISFEIKAVKLQKEVFDKFIKEQLVNRDENRKIDLANDYCIKSDFYIKNLHSILLEENWETILEN